MKKMIQLTLPEFAFAEGYKGKEDELYGRNVILHVRSASVMEVFDKSNAFLGEDVITHTFKNVSTVGVTEDLVMALHHSPLLDTNADRDYIIENIMKPACKWYCDYCDWMDNEIGGDLL
jgi:hypothetical protein